MIDIHSHNYTNSGYTKVVNYSMNNKNEINLSLYFSAGIHPWYLNDLHAQQEKLDAISRQKNCLAIGECGIDKVCQTNLDLQKSVFTQQCKLAGELGKPMIIHCVKAHFETIKILKEYNIKKALFHGFNNRYTILEKILQEGYWVSFGEAILNEKSQASALLKMVPNKKFLLETDDSSFTIDKIYDSASKLLEIETDSLIEQQKINYTNFITI
jgi:TatD DNase family protein